MRDVISELATRWDAGEPIALATVVQTWSSAPRPVGSVMALTGSGAVLGSVSAGCVEGAVYERLTALLAGEDTVERRGYGVSDADAQAHGLTCGGVIDIFTEPLNARSFADFGSVAADIAAGRPVAVLTVLAPSPARPEPRPGEHLLLRPGDTAESPADLLPADVLTRARQLLASGDSGIVTDSVGQLSVFVASYPPLPRLLLFGASDLAAEVGALAARLGYRVTVCDARAMFATAERFPDAAEVVVDWPHRHLRQAADDGQLDERTVICVFTHDLKFEIPLLTAALELPVAYVGALGSRRTNAARLAALSEAGVSDVALSRLRAPIGLDLRAVTPAEIAVSVMAEVIAVRRGGSGAPMTATRAAAAAPRPTRCV